MALLLVVVGVAFPSLKNFFRGRVIDSEARRFLSLTRYGQSRAVSEGVPMVLWIDAREGTYGLQAEAGYLDADNKAVEYELEENLQIEASAALVTASVSRQTRAAQSTGNLPAIRFSPDGFIGETSPETVTISESKDSALWVTQSPNRLNYEIQTSQPALARR